VSEASRYLCFDLGSDEYAIPLLSVREVLALPDITPIPQAPAHFVGIMNLRGSVISIMDLRLKLGIKSGRKDDTTVIILDFGDCSLGVIVDCANSVVSFTPDQVSEKPYLDSGKSMDHITGVVRKNEKLILLLDVAKALSIEERLMLNSQKAS
jgi:purine-binding chemotaxis protein CheW